MSTQVEKITFKSYMDAYVAKEVNLEVANSIATSKSTMILDFLSKIKRQLTSPKKRPNKFMLI